MRKTYLPRTDQPMSRTWRPGKEYLFYRTLPSSQVAASGYFHSLILNELRKIVIKSSSPKIRKCLSVRQSYYETKGEESN